MKGFFSEGSEKSIMRIGFFLCVVVALGLSIVAVTVWASIELKNSTGNFSDKVDISQIIQLVMALLVPGFGGKIWQKSIENKLKGILGSQDQEGPDKEGIK